ncbi:MAG: ribosomal L7Ae/L30e/S12e/Gadd45 family protein [Peptococcaceae bacterium]|jgi:ribosomal protein L7Ae-like RNA K-turn-binding protein|nr:ribosomal L7Ae/L30e/S12e/Gadd45 family protein [Peptococcaceae bacterium]
MSLSPKIGGLIGFAAKSGQLLLGAYAIEDSIKRKTARLVMAAEDISLKRKEILALWCEDQGIPFLVWGTKEEYGRLLRKKPVGLLALRDGQLAAGILGAAKADGGD